MGSLLMNRSEAIFSGTRGPPVFWSEAIFNLYHGHFARAKPEN